MRQFALFFAMSIIILSATASADIPRLISLQGRLTDASDNPITSSTNFAFRIYDVPTGGSALWTEFQTLAPNSLGVFSALLGSVAALNIPFNTSYWLEVQVNSEVLSPRQRMGSAGYALRSESPWNTTGDTIYTTNAGNVGIGTANPGAKLDVAGKIKIGNDATVPSAGTIRWNGTSFEGYNGTSWSILGIGSGNNGGLWTTSGSNIYNTNAGNVGIGTPIPSQKLEVSGSILATGDVCNAAGACLSQISSFVASMPLDYSGSTHTRKQCTDAGGVVTPITGDGANTDVCKFVASSCPSGWAQAGNWQRYDLETIWGGGDYCGNFVSGGPTVFSNNAAVQYSFGGSGTYDSGCCSAGLWTWSYVAGGAGRYYLCSSPVVVNNPAPGRAEIGCK